MYYSCRLKSGKYYAKFYYFFEEKEGMSSLVRVLNNIEKLSIIHQVNNTGWEPFDQHCCGPMTLIDLKKCLNIIYDKSSIDFKRLNEMYTKTSTKPIHEVTSTNTAVGFKMRFRPPHDNFPFVNIFPSEIKISRLFQRLYFFILKVLSDFVENHEEVKERFGERYVSCNGI